MTAAGNTPANVRAIGDAQADRRWVRVGGSRVEVDVPGTRRLDALLQVSCVIAGERCQVAGVDLEPEFIVPFVTTSGKVTSFVVRHVLSERAGPATSVLVRFIVSPEIATLMSPGDRDNLGGLLRDRSAEITSVSQVRRAAGQRQVGITLVPPDSGSSLISTPEELAIADVVVHVPADDTRDGLRYRGRSVKPGELFVLDTGTYLARGWIARVTTTAPTTP
jgi:hypothetical protein